MSKLLIELLISWGGLLQKNRDQAAANRDALSQRQTNSKGAQEQQQTTQSITATTQASNSSNPKAAPIEPSAQRRPRVSVFRAYNTGFNYIENTFEDIENIFLNTWQNIEGGMWRDGSEIITNHVGLGSKQIAPVVQDISPRGAHKQINEITPFVVNRCIASMRWVLRTKYGGIGPGFGYPTRDTIYNEAPPLPYDWASLRGIHAWFTVSSCKDEYIFISVLYRQNMPGNTWASNSIGRPVTQSDSYSLTLAGSAKAVLGDAIPTPYSFTGHQSQARAYNHTLYGPDEGNSWGFHFPAKEQFCGENYLDENDYYFWNEPYGVANVTSWYGHYTKINAKTGTVTQRNEPLSTTPGASADEAGHFYYDFFMSMDAADPQRQVFAAEYKTVMHSANAKSYTSYQRLPSSLNIFSSTGVAYVMEGNVWQPASEEYASARQVYGKRFSVGTPASEVIQYLPYAGNIPILTGPALEDFGWRKRRFSYGYGYNQYMYPVKT